MSAANLNLVYWAGSSPGELFLPISFINHAINPPFPLFNDVLAALIAFWSLLVIKIVPTSFKTFYNYENLLKF